MGNGGWGDVARVREPSAERAKGRNGVGEIGHVGPFQDNDWAWPRIEGARNDRSSRMTDLDFVPGIEH